jgi:molybdopterin synthase catalytic subunit
MRYLTRDPLSVDRLVAEVSAPERGGTCVFLGTVRNGPEEQGVTAIEYSAYEEMVEA